MGAISTFFGNFVKLTRGYDDDDDTFEGAMEEESEPRAPAAVQNAAAAEFENSFGTRSDFVSSEPKPDPEPEAGPEEEQESARPAGAGLFSGIMSRAKVRKTQAAAPAAAPSFRGGAANPQPASAPVMGTAVIYTFNSIAAAGELAAIVCSGQQVIMSLDGIEESMARRLLDVTIGICAAANANITKVSGRTYYVTPRL